MGSHQGRAADAGLADVLVPMIVGPLVRAVEVERVEMLVAPVKDDLEDNMEGREGGIAADEASAPDERTDLAQDDTQLIDVGMGWLRFHAQSI